LVKPPVEKPAKPAGHRFWNTQPVPKTGEIINEDGPIEADKPLDEIRKEPYTLPADFEWFLVDLTDEQQRTETYKLLSENYVEADDASFRFDYTAEFLRWALQPPGWKKDWHLGIRVVKNKKMVAFISGVPAKMMVNKNALTVVEINFLCIHKKLRSKRLAPLLIKEITRRVNLHGIFQAVYTAGILIPRPVTTARYYHRSIQVKKLIEIGFAGLPRDMTMSQMVKQVKLPAKPLLPGLVPMRDEHVGQVTALLDEYLSKFAFAPHLSEEEVRHYLLPLEKVVYSWVVEEEGKVTDFISFYSLPSSVTNHPTHSHIYASYLYYYVPKGLGEDKKRLTALVTDALICAKNEKFDVMNCLALGENETFLDELLFGAGNGSLHYYLFNYRARDLNPDELALVML
ncbi:glycylpeptide N-tetradecanoyltransferase, partial [Kappamyces sp. JEL0680]